MNKLYEKEQQKKRVEAQQISWNHKYNSVLTFAQYNFTSIKYIFDIELELKKEYIEQKNCEENMNMLTELNMNDIKSFMTVSSYLMTKKFKHNNNFSELAQPYNTLIDMLMDFSNLETIKQKHEQKNINYKQMLINIINNMSISNEQNVCSLCMETASQQNIVCDCDSKHLINNKICTNYMCTQKWLILPTTQYECCFMHVCASCRFDIHTRGMKCINDNKMGICSRCDPHYSKMININDNTNIEDNIFNVSDLSDDE